MRAHDLPAARKSLYVNPGEYVDLKRLSTCNPSSSASIKDTFRILLLNDEHLEVVAIRLLAIGRDIEKICNSRDHSTSYLGKSIAIKDDVDSFSETHTAVGRDFAIAKTAFRWGGGIMSQRAFQCLDGF